LTLQSPGRSGAFFYSPQIVLQIFFYFRAKIISPENEERIVKGMDEQTKDNFDNLASTLEDHTETREVTTEQVEILINMIKLQQNQIDELKEKMDRQENPTKYW